MYSWSRLSFFQSRWSAILRQDNILIKGSSIRTLTSPASASTMVRSVELCHSTFTKWKRLLPVVLRHARRHVTTPTRPPSRYLLFGVAGFMWERERISNEEVIRCLKQYQERVRIQHSLSTHQDSTLTSSQRTTDDKASLHQPSSFFSDSWTLGSLLSTVTFGWFGSNHESYDNSNKIRINQESFDESQATSVGGELGRDGNLGNGSEMIDEAQRRKIDFVHSLTEHLTSHSEQRVSQLPLVGLSPKGPSGVSFGSKFVAKATDLKARVLKRVLEAAEWEVKGRDDLLLSDTEQNDCCGSKIADLACLEMESHAHSCLADSDREGDWFQFKISELRQDLYTLSGDQSDLSYHFYPMVGLQERKSSTNKIASLIEGSPLAGILQSIEQLAHTYSLYDHILGIDYHVDRSLAANSERVKTRLKHILTGVVSEVANEIQELREAIATRTLNPPIGHHNDTKSYDATRTVTSLRGGAYVKEVGVVTAASGPVGGNTQESAGKNGRFTRRSEVVGSRFEMPQLHINSFHNFNDVHYVRGEGGEDPPVSRQLGHELLSMLRMARSKVKQERNRCETGPNSHTEQESCDGDGEDGADSSSHTAVLEGWELLARENSNTVYRRMYEDTGLYQYKVIGRYHDITAKDYLEVQVDHKARKTWDTYAVTLETVDSDPKSDCELIYWVMKYPFPLASRDYVFVRKVWVSPKEDAIVFISRSVEHPDYPAKSKFTRVDQYFSEMVIKPHSFVDELGFDYELTYLDNPQINLPSSVVNWVTTTAMPDFLTKIHKAATSRRNQTSKLLHTS